MIREPVAPEGMSRFYVFYISKDNKIKQHAVDSSRNPKWKEGIEKTPNFLSWPDIRETVEERLEKLRDKVKKFTLFPLQVKIPYYQVASHPLKVKWTTEAARTMKAVSGKDMQEELTDLLARELQETIDREHYQQRRKF